MMPWETWYVQMFWSGICYWKTNNINMYILTQWIHRFNKVLIKMVAGVSEEIDRLFLKCIWKCKMPKISKTLLRKKNKTGSPAQ